MSWQDHIEAIKAMYEATESYLRRQKQKEQKKQEMINKYPMKKKRAETKGGGSYIPPVVIKAVEIAENKIKEMEEEKEFFRDTDDFAFELYIEEHWRPCPRCELCPESAYGSFKPQWTWCKKQRGEI